MDESLSVCVCEQTNHWRNAISVHYYIERLHTHYVISYYIYKVFIKNTEPDHNLKPVGNILECLKCKRVQH